MMSKIRKRAAALIVAAILLPASAVAAGVATAGPAFAGTHACEASGHNYCVGTNGTAYNSDVQEVGGSGRDLKWENVSGCYTFNGGCWQKGVLNFYGIGANYCADYNSALKTVVVNACSGVQGDVWYWYQPSGQTYPEFGNQYLSNLNNNEPDMLSGRNVLNDNFLVKCADFWCGGSYYQRFSGLTFP
jgi:hypothetical protein